MKNNYKLPPKMEFSHSYPRPSKNKELLKRYTKLKKGSQTKCTWGNSFWLQNPPSPESQGTCINTTIGIANSCGVTGYHMVSYDYHLNRQTKEEKKKLLSNSEGRRM